ncbi:MAG: cellulase family glycosylhydrolase [Cyclobacteriaceae bacterium]
MKRNFISVLCLLGFVILVNAQLSRIGVKGNQFVDEQGKTVVFRGLNISDPDKLEKQGQWSKRYFEELKVWNANIVRIPIHPARLQERGMESYFKLIDQAVEWSNELGMYVIIDWHSIGNLKSQLYQADMYETDKKQTFEFWRAVAKRYGNNPTVAMYELYNEPTTFNGQLGICSWEDLKEIYEELIVIIRANGGEGIPLVAGFNWAYDLTEAYANPISAEGVGYVSHPYPQKKPQPWKENWTKDWGMMKKKYPVILTEIGYSRPGDIGEHIPVISDDSYGPAITNYCDDQNISYVLWVFDAQWAPRLISDWDFTPYGHGIYFKKKLQSYRY